MTIPNASAEELILCEKIVMDIATILQEGETTDKLSIENESSSYTTLLYGSVVLYVYHTQSRGVDIQANGSGVRQYEDGGLLFSLLTSLEAEILDVFREKDTDKWLRLIEAALPN